MYSRGKQGFVGFGKINVSIYKTKTQGRAKPILNFYNLNYANMTGTIRYIPEEIRKQRKGEKVRGVGDLFLHLARPTGPHLPVA